MIFITFVAVILFVIGILGVIVRRNPIIVLMCIELMLNAANLVLVSYDRIRSIVDGQLFVLTVIAIAAAEVAVGLALIIRIFRHERVPDIDDYHSLSG